MNGKPDGVPVNFTPREDFTTGIRIEPGHAIRRTKGDGSNYGIHSMGIRFLLHGPAATIQFLMWTGLVPEQVAGQFKPQWMSGDPMAADLGYHADAPQWEGQADWGGHSKCEYRRGGACFYDGSGLAAEPLLGIALMDGHGGVFEAMQTYYDEREWVTS